MSKNLKALKAELLADPEIRREYADIRAQFAEQLQRQNLIAAWVRATGHQPDADEMTLLAEAMARLGQYEEAVGEVMAAIERGEYPELLG